MDGIVSILVISNDENCQQNITRHLRQFIDSDKFDIRWQDSTYLDTIDLDHDIYIIDQCENIVNLIHCIRDENSYAQIFVCGLEAEEIVKCFKAGADGVLEDETHAMLNLARATQEKINLMRIKRNLNSKLQRMEKIRRSYRNSTSSRVPDLSNLAFRLD